MHNKSFLLILSFGFLIIGIEQKIEAATRTTTTRQSDSEANNRLQQACIDDDDYAATVAINSGANINLHNQRHCTPLMTACQHQSLSVIKLFLRHKNGNVFTRDQLGDTPLIVACKLKNLDLVKLLLQYGANANDENIDKMTPLHYACGNQDVEMIKWLLRSHTQIPSDLNTNSLALIEKALKELQELMRKEIEEEKKEGIRMGLIKPQNNSVCDIS